jgi:hypothetical protein
VVLWLLHTAVVAAAVVVPAVVLRGCCTA